MSRPPGGEDHATPQGPEGRGAWCNPLHDATATITDQADLTDLAAATRVRVCSRQPCIDKATAHVFDATGATPRYLPDPPGSRPLRAVAPWGLGERPAR